MIPGGTAISCNDSLLHTNTFVPVRCAECNVSRSSSFSKCSQSWFVGKAWTPNPFEPHLGIKLPFTQNIAYDTNVNPTLIYACYNLPIESVPRTSESKRELLCEEVTRNARVGGSAWSCSPLLQQGNCCWPCFPESW